MEESANTSKASLSSVHWDTSARSDAPLNISRLAKRKLTPFVRSGYAKDDEYDCPRCLFNTTDVLALTSILTVVLELFVAYVAHANTIAHPEKMLDDTKGISLLTFLTVILVAQIGLYFRWYIPLLPLLTSLIMSFIMVMVHIAIDLIEVLRDTWTPELLKHIGLTLALRILPIGMLWLYGIYVILRCVMYLRHKRHMHKLATKRKLSDAVVEAVDEDLVIYDRNSPDIFSRRASKIKPISFANEVSEEPK